jgi:hypothetical protein
MTEAAIRIQNRASKDRKFWNENYRPIAINTASEIANLPAYVPRYQTEISTARDIMRSQFGIARISEERLAKCIPDSCNSHQIYAMSMAKAEGFTAQSVMRAEETRQDVRNASRLVKQLEITKVGRGIEASSQSLMAASGKEMEFVARQQGQAYALVGDTIGRLANRAFGEPVSQVRVQQAPSIPVSVYTPPVVQPYVQSVTQVASDLFTPVALAPPPPLTEK